MKKLISLSLCFLVLVEGCKVDYYGIADAASHVITTAVTVAQSELPAYLKAGTTSQQENDRLQALYTGILSLNSVYSQCVDGVHTSTNNPAAYATCADNFAAALSNPATLADVRIINPKAQGIAEVVIIAVVGGLNLVLGQIGGQAATPPPITQVKAADVRQFEDIVGDKEGLSEQVKELWLRTSLGR